jgi:hypothetical protein
MDEQAGPSGLRSLPPPVAAAGVAADEEERHAFLPSGRGLEEDGLAVATGGAAHGLGARQRGVGGDVMEHLRELAGGVVHHVPVHAIVVGDLVEAGFVFFRATY